MNKKEIEKFQKIISRKDKNVFDFLNKKETKEAFKLADRYKNFLDYGKTEREVVQQIINRVEADGFVNIEDAPASVANGSGGKFYKVLKSKSIAAAVIGKKPLLSGANIVAAHIDSPRLDLKQNPLYEDLDIAMLKTHYYGGIRKYHWLAVPLALHGSIVKQDCRRVDISVGEKEEDPVFTVSDLLPHLAGKLQNSKKLSDAFEGEKLNLICGSIPLGDDKIKERFKLGVLKLLYDEYGITEEDFISAELEAVPAFKASDIGFDRSMIGAYGQDDRISAYSALEALLGVNNPHRTVMGFFFDKEEIGSEGNTGAKSNFIESFFSDLLYINGEHTASRSLRQSIIKSQCLSADVNGAMDPDYKEVHEKMNAARLGYGICMTKFTGVRGKAGSSDASAEFVGKVRKAFDAAKVLWQTGELGKVDEGGGGTIAKHLAELGMEVLDCGPSLLSMHSPFEISSKADLYMTCRGYRSFLMLDD